MPNLIDAKEIQELIKSSRLADRQDKDLAELLAGMVRTPAWKAFVGLLESRIQVCSDIVVSPCVGVDAAFGQEYVKGTMCGLLLARGLPDAIVDAIKQELGQGSGDDE
jgi:hypothetical protein